MKKLKTFDLSYFRGKSHYEEDGTQNWFLFQPISRYFKTAYANNNNCILSWISKGLSNLEIDSIKTTNYMLNPYIDTYDIAKIRINFNGGCLKRLPPTILHREIVNIYIAYEITDNFNASNYPTLENCLFESAKLTKSVDVDKYGYSGYGIGFDRKRFFSHPSR